MDALLFSILMALLVAAALYWVVRLAVHHGIHDAELSRREADRAAARGGRASLSATVQDSRHAVPDPEDRP